MSQTDGQHPPDGLTELTALVERIGEVAFDRLDALDTAVTELRARLAEAPHDDTPDKIFKTMSWAATATEASWDTLYEWVDWMADTYGISRRILPPCWPAHPGLVEELAGLRSGWGQARLACITGASDQMSYWHDRCLFPLLDRIKGGTVYALKDCAQGTHKPVTQASFHTDRRVRTSP